MKSEISNLKSDKDKELDYFMRKFRMYRYLNRLTSQQLYTYLSLEFGVVLKIAKGNKQLIIAHIFLEMQKKGRAMLYKSIQSTESTKEQPNA